MNRYIAVTLFFLSTIYILKAQETNTLNSLREKSQNEETIGWIGVSIGPSFPVGVIASTNPMQKDAGFAATGVHLNANIGYKISTSFGLYMLFHTSVNKINQNALENSLSMALPSGTYASYQIKPWQMGGILIGPYYKLPSYGASSFFLRGLVGYANVTTPESIITLSKSGYQSVTSTTESGNFYGLSYALGGGANVKVSPKVQLMLNVDFISTSVTVDNLITSYSNGAPYTISNSYTQPYSVINITGGIAYVIR